MVLKVSQRLQVYCRFYSKHAHYTVLPADTFEGTVIEKNKHVDKKIRCGRPSRYGGKTIITMLPGVQPGPKLMSYVEDVFTTTHVPIHFEKICYTGTESMEENAEFEKSALTSMYRNGVGIKGNITSPNTNFNVALRAELDLFVSLVRCKAYPHVKCKYPDMDIYVCRQNTEGEYAMLEHEARPGVVESLKIITEENTARLAEWCFNFAIREKRKKITIVHKANIMKLSDGLFRSVIKEVGKKYPEIEVDDIIVDNCTMQLVQNPSRFDILISPNLYGNIISNIACGLIGGPGLMSGINYGGNCALFEAGSRHLTYLDENNLNPTAMLNASIDLLRYLGKHQHADIINQAITKTLSEDRIHTSDIGGTHTSDQMVESVKQNIRESLKTSDIKMF